MGHEAPGEQASDAPDDLVARAERLTLDEVQRAPQLLLAVKRAVDRRRRAGRFLLTWFAGYVQTYLERDLRELSAIGSLPDFRRLMRAVSLRLGQLLNQAELGRDVALPQPTVYRWLNLLETSYQLVRLPAYAVNRTKRIIKTAKIYWAYITSDPPHVRVLRYDRQLKRLPGLVAQTGERP